MEKKLELPLPPYNVQRKIVLSFDDCERMLRHLETLYLSMNQSIDKLVPAFIERIFANFQNNIA